MDKLGLRLYVYFGAMMFGAILTHSIAWVQIAKDSEDHGGHGGIAWLILSIPFGAILGVIVMGIADVLVACLRPLEEESSPQKASPFYLASICPT